MKRRHMLMAAGGLPLLGAMPAFAAQEDLPELNWRMISSFPKNLDTIFNGATIVADCVRKLTGGRFNIQTFAAGELVPGLAVLDSVGSSTVEMGHSAGFYYIGQEPSLIFDTGVPFGLTPRQHNAWYYFGGGAEQMDGLYAKFNIKALPLSNTGAQMAGWFRKEINTPEDLSGLKMRVAGFAGRVYAKLGVVPQQIAAGDIYPSLERGTLDAVEFVGPYDDETLGFYKVAKHYYAPGVMEMGAMSSLFIDRKKWEELPQAYQMALETACREAEVRTLASYDAKNATAIESLVAKGAKLGYYSPQIVAALRKATDETLEEESDKNPEFKKIYESWRKFRDQEYQWFDINDTLAERYIYYGK